MMVFNRPLETEKVFQRIRAIAPKTLFIIGDGPRSERPQEGRLCAQVRDVVGNVDWDCNVQRNFCDVNLGCKRRVSSGLDWVFSKADRAIVLEDDCLPNMAFFQFCEEMLDKYENDARVAHIGGTNFQRRKDRSAREYYFSRYAHVWGWASWRRAWGSYDVDMSDWPQRKEANWLESILETPREIRYWETIFDRVYAGEIDTWDYQLTYSVWKQNALAAIPGENLVSNIGFGDGATHTVTENRFADMASESLAFPLRHPEGVTRNVGADRFMERTMFSGTTRFARLRSIIQRMSR